MKWILAVFLFLLPFHAIIVTFLKCKLGIDTDLLRFWKEVMVIFLLGVTFVQIYKKYQGKFWRIFDNNALLGTTVAFIICSFLFIFFPVFEIRVSALLGFKYDVFFLFCLIIGIGLNGVGEHFDFFLKTIFSSIALMLVIFLPWFVFGNIEASTDLLGFSKTPSTYEANSCISFAQNVTGGHHRFQGSFGDPIRGSVFLVVFFFLYLGYSLQKFSGFHQRALWIGIPTIGLLVAVFLSLTKTSMLGFLFGISFFSYLCYTIRSGKKVPKLFYYVTGGGIGIVLFVLLYVKRSLFLHPEAILGRVENLIASVDMFLHNPIGFGLGIAGPASQLATSTDVSLSTGVQKFLPENWYVQILLEQGIVGLSLFLSVLIILIIRLWKIVKLKKDFLSLGIFVSFVSLLFMANFTHIFEESATSFTLFLLLGAYVTMEGNHVHNRQKKRL